MNVARRTRPALVRTLMSATGPRAAVRLARASRDLADEAASRLVEQRFNRWIRIRRSDAAACVRAATAIAAASRDPVCAAVASRIAGVYEHLGGRPVRAAARLESACRILRRCGRWLEAGDVYRALVDVYLLAGRYPRASAAGAASRRMYAKAGGAGPRRLGSLAMNLGNVQERRDRYAEALRSYAAARRHFRAARDPVRLANVDLNRATVLLCLDRVDDARALLHQARETYRKAGLLALAAQADYTAAGVDLREGLLDRCIARLDEVGERQREIGDDVGAAHTDLDRAEALLRLNRSAEAIQAASAALAFFRKAGHDAEQAIAAGHLGAGALQQGRPRAAIRHFERGRDLHRRARNRVAAATLEIGLAEAENRSGQPGKGLVIGRRAARSLASLRLPLRQARALAVAADAALVAGRVRTAEILARRAATLARRRGADRVAFAALLVLGRAAERRGDRIAAFRTFARAEHLVERMRRGVTTEESRLAFALDKSEVYDALIANRFAVGTPAATRQALEYAERGKARALAERLASGAAGVFGAGSPTVRRIGERLEEIERNIALAEARLESDTPRKGIRATNAPNLEALVRARLGALRRLRVEDPRRAVLFGAVPHDPWAAVRNLRDDEVVLEYAVSDGWFHLFAIDRRDVVVHKNIARTDDVHERVERLRFHLGKGVLGEAHAERFGGFLGAVVRDQLERLHDLLLGAVVSRLGGKTVHIVPHGALHGLPFHALETGGSALIDRCVVAYAPSLAVLALLNRRRRRSEIPPLVLGVPDDAAPEIEAEVEAVRRHLGNARVFRGAEATMEAIRLAEKRPSLLHVACHGFFAEGGAEGGGLRLGDTWMWLPDLYGLRGTADLVVLSGCETGRGTVYSGDEWVGLVRGFLQAGARAVVASQWEVHDRSAASIMGDFYGGLARGLPVGRALAEAQREARRKDGLALRWAPFMLIGDPGFQVELRKAA